MSNVDILYKVIILYLLDKTKVALSNSQICEFLVSGKYTDYFNARSILNSLVESELVNTMGSYNTTTFTINDTGKKTLDGLMDRITSGIKEDVFDYLEDNEIAFKKSRSYYSNYDKSVHGGYLLHLIAREDEKDIINMELIVGNEEMAKSICTNWRNNSENIYEILLENLI